MSLNWSVSRVRNWKKVCLIPAGHESIANFPGYSLYNDGSADHPWLTTCIFMTMSIWMGDWTKDVMDEVYARAKLIEALRCVESGEDGGVPFWSDEKKEWAFRPIEPKDIKQFTGLETNVSNDPDRQAWMKRVVSEVFLTDQIRAYERAMKPVRKPVASGVKET